MTISIEDHESPVDTHQSYTVTFFEQRIQTLLTHTPKFVRSWLFRTLHNKLNNHIIGLDVEWLPNRRSLVDNPVAILQLCVGRNCLIFQLIHAPRIPQALINFLSNSDYTFVGVGIGGDVEKLFRDHGLRVSNNVDLRDLAAKRLGIKELRRAGVKSLAREVLGREIEKPKRVTLSEWDSEWLSLAQVQYACVDAFVSHMIGTKLILGN